MKKSSKRTGPLIPSKTIQRLTCDTRSPTAWLPAACFVKAQNTLEVALILKVVTAFQLPFAIRSGGHSANPGFGSVDSGILIDLSSLNDIVLSPDHKVVSVGPGAKSDILYEELEKYEVTVVGGRAAGIGMGGFITGGKWSPCHLPGS